MDKQLQITIKETFEPMKLDKKNGTRFGISQIPPMCFAKKTADMKLQLHDVLASGLQRNATDSLILLSSEHLNVKIDIRLQITIKKICLPMKICRKMYICISLFIAIMYHIFYRPSVEVMTAC